MFYRCTLISSLQTLRSFEIERNKIFFALQDQSVSKELELIFENIKQIIFSILYDLQRINRKQMIPLWKTLINEMKQIQIEKERVRMLSNFY